MCHRYWCRTPRHTLRSVAEPPTELMVIDTVPSELIQQPAMLHAVKRFGRVRRCQYRDEATVHVADKPVDSAQHRRLRGVARAEAMLLSTNNVMLAQVRH